MTAAQKTAKANFKKAIEYRKKTGVSLKEAFAHVYGRKVGAAPKKAAKKVVKKAAPKKVAKKAAPKKHTKYGKVKAHTRRVAGVKKKVSEKAVLTKIHKVKDQVNQLDELQHKHMIGAIKKNFKDYIQYKKHIIDITVTPGGKKHYYASVHPLSAPFVTSQLSIAKNWIDKYIAIKKIKSTKK